MATTSWTSHCAAQQAGIGRGDSQIERMATTRILASCAINKATLGLVPVGFVSAGFGLHLFTSLSTRKRSEQLSRRSGSSYLDVNKQPMFRRQWLCRQLQGLQLTESPKTLT